MSTDDVPDFWTNTAGTPLDQSVLNAREEQIHDLAVAHALAQLVTVDSRGNLGASPTIDMAGKQEVQLYGTLNANAILTVANIVAGQTLSIALQQDATGGRTFSIALSGGSVWAFGASSSGAPGAAVPLVTIPTTAGGAFSVEFRASSTTVLRQRTPVVSVVLAGAPANSALPVISGASATVGEVWSTTDGAWSNTPTSYAYQWQRNAAGTWTDIPGATGSTYLLATADVGALVRARVTASNATGPSPAATSQNTTTAVVAAATGGTNTFTVGAIVGTPQFASPQFDIDRLNRVAAKFIRVEIASGTTLGTTHDAYVRALALQGISMLPLVNGSMPTTSGGRTTWANTVLAVAQRYRAGGTFWAANTDLDSSLAPDLIELINEPYIDTMVGGYFPNDYGLLIKACWTTVRASLTSAQMRLAAAFDTTHVGGANDGANFIDGVYGFHADLSGFFDCITIHPYAHDPSPGDPNARWNFRRIETIKSRMDAKGATGKNYWVTELGNATANDGETETTQATYLGEYVTLLRDTYTYVERFYCYKVQDFGPPTVGSPPVPNTDKEAFFGVVTYTGTATVGTDKPAAAVLRSACTTYRKWPRPASGGGSTPTLPDTFGTAGNPAPGWTSPAILDSPGALQATGGNLATASGAGFSSGYHQSGQYGPNVTATGTINTVSTDELGLLVRLQNPGQSTVNAYYLTTSATTYTIFRIANGVWTSLWSAAQAFAAGDVLRLAVSGTTITAFRAASATPTTFVTLKALSDSGVSGSGLVGAAVQATATFAGFTAVTT